LTENAFGATLQAFYRALGVREFAGVPPSEAAPEEEAPLADRITDVYWLRVRGTGLGATQFEALRGELSAHMVACIRHFQTEAPEEIERVKRMVARYDRLRKAAGIDRRLLEEPSKLLPGVLGHLQAVAEAVLGAIPALIGFLTGSIPYFVTRVYARWAVGGEDVAPGLAPIRQLLVGILPFVLFYGGLVGLTAWQFSGQATVLLAVLLITTGIFALVYAKRMRTIIAHVGNRTASWFKLGAVARVREARDEVVAELDVLRNRYRKEALGWEPLPSNATRPSKRAAVLRVLRIAGLVATAGLFVSVYVDRPVEGLPVGQSPWQALRASDPALAERELLDDARNVLLAAGQLDGLQGEMMLLRAEFERGERDLLTQADHDRIKQVLITYLDLRKALLTTFALYEPENPEASLTAQDPLEARAFLTAYTAAALLIEKAWVLYVFFKDDPGTRQELDRGDLAWSLPPGTFSFIEGSLTNLSVMSELRTALHTFDAVRAADGFPQEAPWADLAARAELARPALDEALDGVRWRKLARVFPEMIRQIRNPVREIMPVVSMMVSRFRLKERPPHRGLITAVQVADLRARLQPGDILIERRNWYISNALLPGYWPHAALYLGSHAELSALGVTEDARAAPHMSDFRGQNERGHDYAVLEAIGEGVIFTSLERSVGEADAVVVLRPILSDDDRREALSRALSHRGKEYDFDFDFVTTDRLVCTELIFRTYDGILDIPELRSIMGEPRITASDFVRMWVEGRASGAPQLELVLFLDFDEANGIAVESDEETLVETLERSRFTFLR
jgi:hypothetical protein